MTTHPLHILALSYHRPPVPPSTLNVLFFQIPLNRFEMVFGKNLPPVTPTLLDTPPCDPCVSYWCNFSLLAVESFSLRCRLQFLTHKTMTTMMMTSKMAPPTEQTMMMIRSVSDIVGVELSFKSIVTSNTVLV